MHLSLVHKCLHFLKNFLSKQLIVSLIFGSNKLRKKIHIIFRDFQNNVLSNYLRIVNEIFFFMALNHTNRKCSSSNAKSVNFKEVFLVHKTAPCLFVNELVS